MPQIRTKSHASQKLCTQLATFDTSHILLGGDDCVGDVELDRSTPPLKGTSISKVTKGFQTWLEGWNMVDTWRTQHGSTRDYS